MGRRYIVEEIEEKSENGGCGSILLGFIAVGVLILVGVGNNDKELEGSTPIQRETSIENKINEETSFEQLFHTTSLNEEEIEESYEELQGDEIPLNEQEVEDCEDVENVKTEYVEEQITSKEQKKADRKKRREAKRKTKQKE